jgi:sarcosine oxidase subunit beta
VGRIIVPTAETFPRTADAVVVGGGIVGVATAFWLSRAGLDTVLVEMRDGLSTLTTPT